MILVFVILGIIILISLIMFLLILSTLKLEIKKLHIANSNEKIKARFVLEIAIYIFNKFKIFKLAIDNEKISNLLKSGKIDIKKLRDNRITNQDVFEMMKQSEFKIEHFKLGGYFSTFNTVLSTGIYAFINAVIPIVIARKIDGKYINELKFLNVNENKININLNCIISVKMVNIINILHYLKKKGGNNNGKSSDRRTYAYSNE